VAKPLTVAVEGLSVRFGSATIAVDELTAEFGPGVNCILGPNGAGKTTLFRVITGAIRPTDGNVSINGAPLRDKSVFRQYLANLGYLPQEPSWFEGFKTLEPCEYVAGLRRMPRKERRPRAREALERVGLSSQEMVPLAALSGGQRRRAFLAQALVHDPAVVVLDEPTSGLDPAQRVQVRSLISSLGERSTVLLSTHLVEDAAHVADTIIVLENGSKAWQGSPQGLAELGTRTEERATSAYERGFLSLLGGSE
jgi:ABC-2 type transport system ATP-binding protein